MSPRLKQFLEENHVPYQLLFSGEEAFTAQEIAARLHVSGKKLAKPVFFKADGRLHMAVLPADRRLDLNKAARLVGAARASLAREEEFAGRFPDCEVGAEPPIGRLYGLDTLLDEHLRQFDTVVFLGGDRREAVELGRADYERLAEPGSGDICQPWQ